MLKESEHFEISDEMSFYNDIYFTFEDAVAEIKRRQADVNLINKIKDDLRDIPIPLSLGPKINSVLFRQIATPNYETRRFLHISDGGDLNPILWEYLQDKFVSNNEYKRSLGKVKFFLGEGKKGGKIIESETIIDFNSSNGKPLNEVMCINQTTLVDFHRKLFFDAYPNFSKNQIFDASDWFKDHGKKADEYYVNFLTLFIVNGILFENFMLNEEERCFTENIFYPSYKKVLAKYGLKPIIVALEPTDIEGDEFWMCHTPEHYKLVVQ
jgi:hypothetical protein